MTEVWPKFAPEMTLKSRVWAILPECLRARDTSLESRGFKTGKTAKFHPFSLVLLILAGLRVDRMERRGKL